MEREVKNPLPDHVLSPPSSPLLELSYEQLFSFQVTYTSGTGYPTQKKKKKWKRAILQVDFSMKAFFLRDKDQIYLSQVFTSLQQHSGDEYTGSCRLSVKFNFEQWNVITQNQAEKQCLQHLLQCILDNTSVEDAAARGREKGVIGLDKTVVKHGTIQRKTAHEVKLSNRFLVLVPGKLLFFKDKDIVGKHIRYVTTLVGATVRMVAEQIELQIVAPNSKAIAIVAPDIKELTSWSTSITIAMDCAKHESKRSESNNTSSTLGSSDTEPVEILLPNGETQQEKKHERNLLSAKLVEWEGRSTRRGQKRNGSMGRTRALFCLESAIDDMVVSIGKIKAEKRQASAPPEFRFTSADNQFREQSGDHIHPDVVEEPNLALEDQTSENSVQRRDIEGRSNDLFQMINALVPQLKMAREIQQGSLSGKDPKMPSGSTSILPRDYLQIHDQQMPVTRSRNSNYEARISSAAFHEQPLLVSQQQSNSNDEGSMEVDHVHAEGVKISRSLVEDDRIRRSSLEKERRRESEGEKKSLIDSSSRRESIALSPQRMPRERTNFVLSEGPSVSSKHSYILRGSQSYQQPIQDTRSEQASFIPRTSSSTFQQSYPSVGAQKNNSSTEDSMEEEDTIQTPGVVSGDIYSAAHEKRKGSGGGANIFFPTKQSSPRKESIPPRLVIERASSLSSKIPTRSSVRVSQSYAQSPDQNYLLNGFSHPSFLTDNSESSIENREEVFYEPQKQNFNAVDKDQEIVIDTSEEDESQSTNEELTPQERGTKQGRATSRSSFQRNSQVSPTKNPNQIAERKSTSQGTNIGSLSRNSYADVEVHKEQDESAASEGYSESSLVYHSLDCDSNRIGGKQSKRNSLKPSELKLGISRASLMSSPQKRPSKYELAGLEVHEAQWLGSKRNSRDLSSRDENAYRGGEDGNKGRRDSSRQPYLQTHDDEEPHPFIENSIHQKNNVPERALEISATKHLHDSNGSISLQAHSSEEEGGAVLEKNLSEEKKSQEQGQNRGSIQQVSSNSSDTTTKPSSSKQYLQEMRPSALLPRYSASSKPGKTSLSGKRQSQREAKIDRSPSLVTDSRTKLSQIKSSSSDSSESLRSSMHQSPRGTEGLTDWQPTNKEEVFSPKHSVNSGDRRESQQLRPVSLMNNPLDLQEVRVPVGNRMDDGEREEKKVSSLPSVEPKQTEDSLVLPQNLRTFKYARLIERRQSQERVREFSAAGTPSDIQDSLSSSSFKSLRQSRLHEEPATQESSELGDRKESVEPKIRSSKFRPSLGNMEQRIMPETDKASDNFKVETRTQRGSTNRDKRQRQSQMKAPKSQSKEEEITDVMKPNVRRGLLTRSILRTHEEPGGIIASSPHYQNPQLEEDVREGDVENHGFQEGEATKQMQEPFNESFEAGTQRGDTLGSFNRSSFRNARESQMQELAIITSFQNYPSPEVDEAATENVENIALGYKDSKNRSSFENAQRSQIQDPDPYDASIEQDDEPNFEDPTFRFSFDMGQRGIQDMERTTEESSEQDPRAVQPQTKSYSNRMKFPSEMDESSSPQSDDSSETKETAGGLQPNSIPEYSYNRIKLSKINEEVGKSDELEQRAQIQSQSGSGSEDGIRTPQRRLHSARRRPKEEEYEREFTSPQSNRSRSKSRKQSQAEMSPPVSSSEDGIRTPEQSFNSEGQNRSQRQIQEEFEQEVPIPKSTLQLSQSRRQSESEMLSSDSKSENGIRAYRQRMKLARKRKIQVESDQNFPTSSSSKSRRQNQTERLIPDSSSEDEIGTPNQTFHSAPKREIKEEYEKELTIPQSRRQIQMHMLSTDPRSEDGTRTRQQGLHSAGKRQSQAEYEMDAPYIQDSKLRDDRKIFRSPRRSRSSLQFEPGARRFMNICNLYDGALLTSQDCEQKRTFSRSSASTILPHLVQLAMINIGSRRYKQITLVINLDSQRCNTL